MDMRNQGSLGAEGTAGAGAAESVEDSADPGQNRPVRDSLLMIARFSYADGAGVYEVRVRNLSEGGLMIEFDRPLAVDTPVTIDLRGIGEVTGRVAWCTQGRLGIALDETIDPMKARKSVGQGQTTPTFAKPIVFREPRSR